MQGTIVSRLCVHRREHIEAGGLTLRVPLLEATWCLEAVSMAICLIQGTSHGTADTQNLEPLAACLYKRLTLRYGPQSLGLVG